MDGAANNQRIASALFRAGLLDEATIRRALDECRGQDLGAFLVRAGRVRPDDLQRALSRPSGSLPVRPSDPALDLTVRTGPPASAVDPALDLTVRTDARPTGRASGAFTGSSTSAGSSPGTSSLLSSALAVTPGEDVPPGTQLGPYVVRRLIARGGMGAVFAAEHVTLRRTVALKVLLSGEGATDEQLERFLLEARASSKLNHPNVVPVYEVGDAGGVRYMTMELVEGPSLRQVVQEQGPLPPRRALHLVEQVARGVAAAHAEKIVHRDLKPHNVLVAPGDVAKVMDFGLARETDQAGRGLTVSGALLGTPSYMAPEQAAGERVGPPADVYGLGAILYECLTGRPPFEGPTLANIITRVLTTDVVAPRQARPTIHPDVETICLKALEKDPRRRYPSARALADDMARWLAGEAIQARPLGRAERLRRWSRKRVPHLVGGGVAAAALLTLAVWTLVISPRERAALERRLADEQRAAAAAALEHEVAALSGALDDARRRLAGIAPTTSAEVRAGGRVVGEVEAALRQAYLDLSPDARTRVAAAHGEPPFVDVAGEQARLWLELARGAAHEPERRRALGSAYAAAPTSPAGREAIVELATTSDAEGAAAIVDQLLRTEGGLTPAHEVRLRRARAQRRVARRELEGAAQDLARLAALDAGVPALEDFVRPLLRGALLEVRAGVIAARVVRRAAGPASVELTFDDRSGGVFELAPGDPPRLVPLAEVAAPALGEHGTGRFSAFGGQPGRPLGAHVTSTNRLVLTDRDGRVLVALPRSSQVVRELAFMELDDDPATDHLVLVLGPNEGDSLVVRIDGRGVATQTDLDPAGRSALDPRLRGAASYIDEAVCVPTRAGPRLVLAYGAWGANCFRVLRAEGQGLVVCGPPVVVGMTPCLAWAPGPDGDPWLVAAHHEQEEDRDPAWTPRGVAAYRLDGDRVVAPPAAVRPLEDLGPAARAVHAGLRDSLRVVRTPRGLFALYTVLAGADDPEAQARRSRFRLVRLDGDDAAPLVDVPLTEDWRATSVGDLLGTGHDQVLLLRDGALEVLGLAGAAPRRDEPAPDVTRAQAAAQAVGHLERLGLREQAAERLTQVEADTGPTLETEAAALEVLVRRERSIGYGPADAVFAPDEDFLEAARRFGAAARRSPSMRARAAVLRAHHLLRAGRADVAPRAAAALDEVDAPLPPEDEAERRRLARVVALRGGARAGLTRKRLVVDFTAPDALTLVASDPVRVRLVPGEGLVARLNRRVPLVAGVPVELPPGAVRLTARYRIEGTTWYGLYELGLLRARDLGPTLARSDLEGLLVGGRCWQAAGSYRRMAHALNGGFGRPTTRLDGRDEQFMLHRPGDGQPLVLRLGLPFVHRAHLEVVLEHDPRSGRSNVLVRDLDAGVTLFDRHGVTGLSLPPGPYLAGLAVLENRRVDFVGQNFPPFATLTLERLEVDCVPGVTDVSLRALPPARAGGLLAERAGGLGALVESGRADLAEAVGAYEPSLADAPPERRAGLLVQRADVRARAGDLAGARDDLQAAWRGSPFGFLRAVEDDGLLLAAPTAAAARDLLRDALRELDRRLEAAPDDAAALEARAITRRLRGEDAEALADLDRAEAAAPGDRARERLWVRAPLLVSDGAAIGPALDRLAGLWGPTDRPERPEFMRSLWAPEVGADGAAVARAEVERLVRTGARSWLELDRWLARWAELAPDDPEPRVLRANVTGKSLDRGGQLHRVLDDLRAALDLRPDARVAEALALYSLARLDYLEGGRLLRELERQGAGASARRVLAQLGGAGGARDVDVERFTGAVLGDEAAWRAFREAHAAAGVVTSPD